MRGSDQRGMALILTLLTISFLVAVTVHLGSTVNWQMQASANQKNIVQLDAMLLSGLNLARAALLADQQENEFDSGFDSWGEFDSEILAELFGSMGKVAVRVEDMSGLLQVNSLVLSEAEKKKREKEAKKKKTPPGKKKKKEKKKDLEKLQREMWKRFLLPDKGAVTSTEEERDEETVQALLDALADWLDEDDDERDNGVELSHYSSQKPSYAPANGPILFLEELLLIKDWDKKLLYGDKDKPGIIQYLTPGSSEGKININMAPAKVLQVLHEEMTEELAEDIIEFRQDEENEEALAEPTWYKKVNEFPGDIIFEEELVTISSNTFKIIVHAEIAGLRRTGEGIILRLDNQEQELVYWKVE